MATSTPQDFSAGCLAESANANLTPSQREALATLIVTIERSEGWAMVVGPAGSGKGELLDCLLGDLPDNVAPVMISSQCIHSSLDLFRQIGQTLGMPECNYKGRFLIDFRDQIEQCRRKGGKILILVKEAHLLSEEMLRELELLGNTDQYSPRVLNIVFFARPQILQILEAMGATNLKHHLRRFRRLEPKLPGEPVSGERRHGRRVLKGIDYSWGNDF